MSVTENQAKSMLCPMCSSGVDNTLCVGVMCMWFVKVEEQVTTRFNGPHDTTPMYECAVATIKRVFRV